MSALILVAVEAAAASVVVAATAAVSLAVLVLMAPDFAPLLLFLMLPLQHWIFLILDGQKRPSVSPDRLSKALCHETSNTKCFSSVDLSRCTFCVPCQ